MAANKQFRKIIEIDENKCNGCGLCATACHESAIQIVDGKAKLISDIYCDGFGDCLGKCPPGAIKIIEREAEAYDDELVKKHIAQKKNGLKTGCPGTSVQIFSGETNKKDDLNDTQNPSMLTNWPTQLNLVPINAPYFSGSELVISADCTPFAFADFHKKFIKGKILLNGCPKLDNAMHYKDKLAQIFSTNNIKSVEVVYMEVPCCGGLVRIIELALDESNKNIPLTLRKISLRGEILERKQL